jgi:ATP-dependent phosphofructokinase / diphosphate-dependent phosphofructokinase
LHHNEFRGKTLAILVGGGPAPGINGVIRSITIQAQNVGLRVLGIYDGFHWLSKGDTTKVVPLDIEGVSRIHFQGGSILRTSRTNPGKSPEMMAAVVRSLRELGVQYLITIGGDDTATTALRIQEMVGGDMAIAHVPKTIDNDLPLPRYMSTFGFQTARHVGAGITKIILEDARTSERWFFLVSMGRKAGHLALGIGKAAGATLTVIGEEFRNEKASLDTICDILEGAIIKRLAMGRRDGVAVLAEGLSERVDPEEMARYVAVERDAHGNIRLGEIELGRMLKNEVRRRLKERGISLTIVEKDIGYECRCADPIPFDLEYTQDLGYAAVTFLVSGGSGAMVTVERGRIIPMPFHSLIDEATGKARIREVDIDSDSYRVARHYMIRLDPADFEESEHVARLAAAGNLSPEAFVARFKYLTLDPPVRRVLAH